MSILQLSALPQQPLQLPLRLPLQEIRKQPFYLFNSERNALVYFATRTIVVQKLTLFCFIRPKNDTLFRISGNLTSVSFLTTIV